jgi:hypothetical protein
LNLKLCKVKKKPYIKPDIEKIELDNTLTLLMQTPQPTGPQPDNPNIRTDGSKGPASDPFASPFGDKPFN